MIAPRPPLLVIAEGGTPRLRKALQARPKELALHIAVAQILRRHALPEWLWWHTPNGELRDGLTAAKLKAMGVTPGVPDIVLVSPYGSVRFLELKRAGEALSEAQEDFRIFCIRRGIPHAIAHNFDQALAALDKWQCLRLLHEKPDDSEALP